MNKEIQKSAGLLMWDIIDGVPKVLLCHPGGPYFKNKNFKSWGIPKGLIKDNEEILEAAIREFEEETSIKTIPPYESLGSVIHKNGKIVYAYTFHGKFPGYIKSNIFEMEWPPKSGKIQSFPENDKGEMFIFEEAMKKIIGSQEPFIERLQDFLTKKHIL